MNEEFNTAVKALEDKIDAFKGDLTELQTLKGELETIKQIVEDSKFDINKSEEYKTVVSRLNKLELEETDKANKGKGQIVKFFEDTIEKGDIDNRQHSA